MKLHDRVALRAAVLVLGLAALAIPAVGAAPALAAGPGCVVTAQPLAAATGYTEFIAGNGSRGSESEGAIAWGGNLNANGMTVGTRLSSAASAPTLVVAGTHGTFNLQKGSAYLNPKSGVNFNGGGSYLAANPIDFTDAFATLTARSTSWGTATANGTAAQTDIGVGGTYLLLKGTDATLNVFSVTPAQLAAGNGIAYDVPPGSTVLVNVSGASVTLQGQMWIKQGGGYTQVNDNVMASWPGILWNFPSATGITMTFGSAWGGSILAPKANLGVASVGHTIGQVVAAQFSSSYETHQNLFPASACLPSTEATPSKANLRVTKAVSSPAPRPGQSVTYTITAANDGPAPAQDVVVNDALPAGVTYVSATSPCTFASGSVSCALGTLAAGASRSVQVVATVDAVPTGDAAVQHDLDVQKYESQVDLDAGQTRTVTVDCAPGYLVLDGSGRIDAVDQGTGTPASVHVLASSALDADTWAVTMLNDATGRAQGKAYAVCVRATTATAQGHSHPLVVTGPITQTVPVSSGQAAATLSCATGQVPVAPGYRLDSAAGSLTSRPAGETGWSFTATGLATTSTTFSIRCLATRTGTVAGHQHDLGLNQLAQSVTVPAGQTVEQQVTCADDAKGVVAGIQPGTGLVALGNDPRPKTRAFRLLNPTGAPVRADLWLLCLGTRTAGANAGGTVVNTASGSTSTLEASYDDNSGSASFTVDTSPAPVASPASTSVALKGSTVATSVSCSAGRTACTGTATLVALTTQKVAGRTVRKGAVLARATYKVGAGKKATVKLKPTALGAKVLRAKGLKKASLKVGTRARTVTVRH